MKTIYKYTLPLVEIAELSLPIDAEIIRIDGVNGFVYLWAIVDSNAEKELRQFYLFKTGQEIPTDKNLKYLGCGGIVIGQELMLYIFENVRN